MIEATLNKIGTTERHQWQNVQDLNWRLPPVFFLNNNNMELEQLKKELSNAYIDLGNGFKFSIENIIKESHDIYGESIIIKVHPSSKRWIEIEQKLKN